jgi:type IV pilus assembly protein PilV
MNVIDNKMSLKKYNTRTKDKSQQVSRISRTSGFSLIEVLIAVIILAIGLLGIAGLQVTSKRTSFEALQRVTAVMLSQDIVERMRANKAQLSTYTAAADVTGTLTAPSPNCTSATCDPDEIVDYDLYQWQQAIVGAAETKTSGGVTTNTGGLILPTGCITAGATTGEATVAIAWRGLTKLSNPSINTCGAGTNNYDDAAAGDNLFRKVIEVKTFVLD